MALASRCGLFRYRCDDTPDRLRQGEARARAGRGSARAAV